MSILSITVKATVFADSQKVWDCYTQPEHITQWNFASDDWICPAASNDLRIGGKYSARMEARDGSFGFDFEAIYDNIEVGRGFTYTMLDGRKASVEFNQGKQQTDVVITFDAENENSVELQRNGWQAILNNFKKYVESL
jgi:uncharacterized protein YndB with AHSA1/START domain